MVEELVVTGGIPPELEELELELGLDAGVFPVLAIRTIC
jgi:hypothetical protein